MFKFNNSIVPNKVRIGWHFLSNKYAYRDAYSALKSNENKKLDDQLKFFGAHFQPLTGENDNSSKLYGITI